MYLCKRPIYNDNLKRVALEINAAFNTENSIELIDNLKAITNTNKEKHPLFMPFQFKTFLDDVNINCPVILKVNANEVDEKSIRNEINDSSTGIALMMNNTNQLAWLNFVDYVGFDKELVVNNNMKKVVQFIHDQKNKVIAYDIDTQSRFQQCKNMAMDYYCGDFLYEPNLDDDVEISANKMNLMKLVNQLQDNDASFDEITQYVSNDPALSYQLLRVANSAAFSGINEIESIQQAIVRLGFANLKNLVMTISMKLVSDKPIELMESGLIRAHMCQDIALELNKTDYDTYYTLGLLSVLDTVMDCSMEKLLKSIQLKDEIKCALLGEKGELGDLLAVVSDYEEGAWERLDNDKIQGIDICKFYIEAMEKASLTVSAMK
jgi:c-di-GMP phosphodiesterase